MAGIGIDCGSAACKGALVAGGELLFTSVRPTGWNPRETARELLEELLTLGSLTRGSVRVVATGYGRTALDFSDRAVTEITCHGAGALHLLPDVRTVVDIGGQDAKVIALQDGRVATFQMNDKCAAGTGRFLEMTALRLGVDPAGFGALLAAGERCAIGSMCAVFAESEIVSLLAAGRSREEVAGGAVDSVAARVAALAGRIRVTPPVLLTGGLCGLEGVRTALEQHLGCAVSTMPEARYAGAIGAALLAEK